jgi:hypothetical protein
MCLNLIIAHETYHYYLDLPLKLAPTCFTKQRGTSKLNNLNADFCFCSTNCNVWNLGACNIPLENTFPTLYCTPPNVLKLQLQNEKENL